MEVEEDSKAPQRTPAAVLVVSTALFDKLNGKGGAQTNFLNWKEFTLLCKYANASEKRAKELWKFSDKDQSGTLSRKEFFDFCAVESIWPTVCKIATQLRINEHAEQRDVAERLFQYLDKDNNSRLSWEEFAALCKSAGTDQNQAQKLWSETDVNLDGNLSFAEFSNFVARPDCWDVALKIHTSLLELSLQKSKGKVERVAQLMFDFLDGKGAFSTKDNLLRIDSFTLLCKEAGADEKRTELLFRQADKDNSGSLSRQEFLHFCARDDVWPSVVKIEAYITNKGYNTSS